MSLKSRNKVSPNFNMSSMTDIVFLLLIFFMLTSTLVTQNALDLVLPESSSTNAENPPISVQIMDVEDNTSPTFYIDENPIEVDNLENALRDRLNTKKESDREIMLQANNTVDIEHVVFVMDIAYRNKFSIVLATSQ